MKGLADLAARAPDARGSVNRSADGLVRVFAEPVESLADAVVRVPRKAGRDVRRLRLPARARAASFPRLLRGVGRAVR
jgi:hypothetical protein